MHRHIIAGRGRGPVDGGRRHAGRGRDRGAGRGGCRNAGAVVTEGGRRRQLDGLSHHREGSGRRVRRVHVAAGQRVHVQFGRDGSGCGAGGVLLDVHHHADFEAFNARGHGAGVVIDEACPIGVEPVAVDEHAAESRDRARRVSAPPLPPDWAGVGVAAVAYRSAAAAARGKPQRQAECQRQHAPPAGPANPRSLHRSPPY